MKSQELRKLQELPVPYTVEATSIPCMTGAVKQEISIEEKTSESRHAFFLYTD
jgi:hypothetical protein